MKTVPTISLATRSFRSRSENLSASVSASHSRRKMSAIRAISSIIPTRLAGRTGIIPGNSRESFAIVFISDDVKEDSLHGGTIGKNRLAGKGQTSSNYYGASEVLAGWIHS